MLGRTSCYGSRALLWRALLAVLATRLGSALEVQVATYTAFANAVGNSAVSSIVLTANISISSTLTLSRTVTIKGSCSSTTCTLDAGGHTDVYGSTRHFILDSGGNTITFQKITFANVRAFVRACAEAY